MKIIMLIIAVVFILFVISVIAVKKGLLQDRDGDGVADVIEDKIDDVKEAADKLSRKKPGRKKK
tara:strand:+ start:838 stop:1029 length:192 start_codon:yes stop_codon:yes gene_type:complete